MFNSKKRKHFKALLEDLERVAWEAELNKFQLLQRREEIRKQYDQSNQALETIKARLESDKTNKETIEEFKKVEEIQSALKGTLDGIDIRINGGEVFNEEVGKTVPVEGATEKIEKCIKTKMNVEMFIKYNC